MQKADNITVEPLGEKTEVIIINILKIKRRARI